VVGRIFEQKEAKETKETKVGSGKGLNEESRKAGKGLVLVTSRIHVAVLPKGRGYLNFAGLQDPPRPARWNRPFSAAFYD